MLKECLYFSATEPGICHSMCSVPSLNQENAGKRRELLARNYEHLKECKVLRD